MTDMAMRDLPVQWSLTANVPQGATNKMIAAADACYANDWGCSVHQLGLRELITEARRTDASEWQLQL